jgi:hypothetical protein
MKAAVLALAFIMGDAGNVAATSGAGYLLLMP